MTTHLSPGLLNALVDGELSAAQLREASAHLEACPACTAEALQLSLLKSANARAGLRYAAPPHLASRLTELVRAESHATRHTESQNSPAALPASARAGRRSVFTPSSMAAWAAACAALLLLCGVFAYQQHARRSAAEAQQEAAFLTEACDQHISILAASAPPQVLSSDRHTVKPWFQGKLPFSFNLPDNLPQGTQLDGANLAYFRGQPAAVLLYSVGRHRVSVILQETSNHEARSSAAGDPLAAPLVPSNHAGFHAVRFFAGPLDGVAISDVEPARLSELAALLQHAQSSAPPESQQQGR